MSENREKILSLTLADLKAYRSVRQCALDLGYEQHSWVAERIRRLGLGFDLIDLGIDVLNKSVKIISPEEFEILKKDLAHKRKAGRKPKSLNPTLSF